MLGKKKKNLNQAQKEQNITYIYIIFSMIIKYFV